MMSEKLPPSRKAIIAAFHQAVCHTEKNERNY